MSSSDHVAKAVPSSHVSAEDRVPLPQKFGFGLGSIHDMWGHWFYSGMAFLVFNITLGVSPEWIGLALFIKLIFEAIWDSVFGWWSDNVRTPLGRRRPFILVGSVLSGAFLPMLFWVQPGWSEMQYFWFMVGTMAVFVPIMSCFYMPYLSLQAELTPDYNERTAVGAVRNAMQKAPELAMFAAGAFATAGIWVGATWSDIPSRLSQLFGATIDWFAAIFSAIFAGDLKALAVQLKTIFGWAPAPVDVKPNVLLGAQTYTLILGSIMVVAGLLCFFLVRERYYEKLVAGKQGKISIKETLWKTLGNQPFRANLAMALAYGVGTSMVGTLGYYATIYYVCRGDVAAGTGWNFWMGLSGMALGLCGIPVYTTLARRVGKKVAMIVVQLSAIAAFAATWFLYTPSVQWLQVLACGFIAFTGAGFWTLYGSMTADVIDADELATGKRREGAFSACGSWITKLGVAIGSGTSGLILKATGFDQALGANQTENAIFSIRFFLAAIPITGLIIAIIALARFPLTPQRMAEIRSALEQRRGKV